MAPLDSPSVRSLTQFIEMELTQLQKGAEISAVEAESGGTSFVGVNGPQSRGPRVLRPEPFS